MFHPSRIRASVTGTGEITYARPELFGGIALLRGEDFTARYRPHLHTTYVIGVVERGCLALVLRGRTHLLTPGCILVLNPCEVHEESSLGPSGWSFRHFFPGEPVLQAILGGSGIAGWKPWFADPVVRDERIARRLVRLHESLLRDTGPVAPAVEAGFADVIGALVAAYALAGPQGGPRRQVLRVRDHIHAGSAGSLTLESLAAVGKLSPFHLLRVFHREIGLPPHAYYEQLRVARSKVLLQERRRLSEVACLMGYSDQSHFTRQFGDTVGVSPGNYAVMVGAPGLRLPLPARRAQFHSRRRDELR